MQELIERLEKAAASRDLDYAAYEAIGAVRPPAGEFYWIGPSGNNRHYESLVPRYTCSIDDALALVPQGWIIEIHRGFDDDGEYWSKVILVDSFSIDRGTEPDDRREVMSYGAGEPPRFIAAAAFKARSALLAKHGEGQ